jgi:Nucleotide-diphospho-sugar transferase
MPVCVEFILLGHDTIGTYLSITFQFENSNSLPDPHTTWKMAGQRRMVWTSLFALCCPTHNLLQHMRRRRRLATCVLMTVVLAVFFLIVSVTYMTHTTSTSIELLRSSIQNVEHTERSSSDEHVEERTTIQLRSSSDEHVQDEGGTERSFLENVEGNKLGTTENVTERTERNFSAVSSWPPSDMIDALLREATLPSSIHTKQGNTPRLIVCASNADYTDFADNFANSLLALNVTNFVFVPLDAKAYDILREAYPQHTLPPMPGLDEHPDGPTKYGDAAFKQLTSTRPTFLLPFLLQGYAIFYSDIDMVWQHNAWDIMDVREEDNDVERTFWQDHFPMICSCLLYLHPTADSILLLKEWEKEMESEEQKSKSSDQDALNVVANNLNYPQEEGGTVGKTRVYKNDEQFPSGIQYTWYVQTEANDKAVIVHNNYIIGKENKKARFIDVGLWKPSGRIIVSHDA